MPNAHVLEEGLAYRYVGEPSFPLPSPPRAKGRTQEPWLRQGGWGLRVALPGMSLSSWAEAPGEPPSLGREQGPCLCF